MKKDYISPEFDLKIIFFESLMSGMLDSRPEDGASDGNEGGGGEFGG